MKTEKLLLSLMLVLGCASCMPDPDPMAIGVPQDEAYLARGKELVRGLAACGMCHGAKSDPDSPLTGGRVFHDRYGEVRAANLTPAKSGLADWTPVQIMQAIRSSIGRDGQELSEDMHEGFEWLSDEDALAIVAYLKAVPAMENKVERRDVSWFKRNTVGMFESREVQTGYVPGIEPKYTIEYGKYLFENVARAKQCLAVPADDDEDDTNWFAKLIFGNGVEKDTSLEHPFRDWTIDEIVYYLQTSEKPENRESGKGLVPTMCPIKFYRNASETDLRALATYLKSL